MERLAQLDAVQLFGGFGQAPSARKRWPFAAQIHSPSPGNPTFVLDYYLPQILQGRRWLVNRHKTRLQPFCVSFSLFANFSLYFCLCFPLIYLLEIV